MKIKDAAEVEILVKTYHVVRAMLEHSQNSDFALNSSIAEDSRRYHQKSNEPRELKLTQSEARIILNTRLTAITDKLIELGVEV